MFLLIDYNILLYYKMLWCEFIDVFFRAISFFVSLLVITHWVACFWITIACPRLRDSCVPTGWGVYAGDDHAASAFTPLGMCKKSYTTINWLGARNSLCDKIIIIHKTQNEDTHKTFSVAMYLNVYIVWFWPTLGDSSVFEKYAISFYWAVITTNQVGYGDIVAHTTLEVSELMNVHTRCTLVCQCAYVRVNAHIYIYYAYVL